MPHISLPDLPGIRALMTFRPETAKPLNDLAEVLLRGPNTLSPGERELIAAFVSARNDCDYCRDIHGAAAAHQLEGGEKLVEDATCRLEQADLTGKMKALLGIAGKVQQGGKEVNEEDIERARREGATDIEIHDTVLIAAAFCMYNRYVDGLATFAPRDPDFYRSRGALLVEKGYAKLGREYGKKIEASSEEPGETREGPDPGSSS